LDTVGVTAIVLVLIVVYTVAAIAKKRGSRSTAVEAVSNPPERPARAASSIVPTVASEAPAVAHESSKSARKGRASSVPEITVETPLGPVTLKQPKKSAAGLVIALGQSEDHLDWFYDVYRREYLERATANLKAYKAGRKGRSSLV
jgi:hypothetical protein